MTDDDRPLAIRTLVNFSHTATQLASLLEAEGEQREVITLFRETAEEAGTAKSTLITSNRGTVRSVAKSAGDKIQLASGRAAGLITQYQVKVSA